MLRKILYSLISLLFLFVSVWSADEEEVAELTLPSGEVITLDQDYETWEFKKGGTSKDLSEDKSITLQDNRIILLKKDYSYEFLTKKELRQRQKNTVSVKSAHGDAKTTDIDVNKAKNEAIQTIIKELTDDIYNSLKQKPDYAKLKDCVKKLKKDVKSDENFTEGKGWTVSMRVDLGEMEVATAVECARENDEEEKSD